MSLSATLTATPTDDEVRFEYEVTNAGEEAVELTFTSGQTADVVVRTDGETVWRWSDGRMFTQAIETRTLGPGESMTAELTWDEPVPGSYTAEATLAAQEQTAPATTTFEVD